MRNSSIFGRIRWVSDKIRASRLFSWAGTATRMAKNGLALKSNISIGEMVYHSLCVHADKVGHISYDTGAEKLNGQILEEAVKSCLLLRQRYFLETGDTIGVFVEPDDPIISITFGAIFNGNPLHFIDPRFDLGDIHQLFNETQPKLVLCGYSCRTGIALKASLDKTKVVFVEEFRKLWRDFDNDQLTVHDVNFSRHDTISIISMSGKSDKFERITHDNIVNQRELPLFDSKTFLSFKSWNVYADISNLLATTIMGATRIVTRDRFNCKLVQDIVDEYSVNILQLTAYQLQQMRPASVTGNHFETLEKILCIGPKVTNDLINFSAVCFPNSEFYHYRLTALECSTPSTPGSPEFINGRGEGPFGSKNGKNGFLRTLFRKTKKQKSVEM